MGIGGLPIALICAFFVCVFGATLRQEVSEELKLLRSRQRRQANNVRPIREVKVLDIKSKIAMRFASTTIVCRITNKGANSERITFPLEFPDNAYITEFTVVVDGDDEIYYGKIRDRCEGSDEYTFSASGDVPPNADPLWNNFTTAVYLRPRGHVTYTVTYQEILRRVRGSYSLVISVKPGHVVSDFGIDVQVTEAQGISYINAGFFNFSSSVAKRSSELSLFSSVFYGGRDTLNSQNEAIDSILGDDVNRVFLSEYITNKKNQNNRASFRYDPSKAEQQAFNSDLGLYGVFVLSYDVEHDDVSPGDVMVADDFFVHYFSPSGLQALPKDVVFAFDVSASMYGRKLTQTKMALKTILDDLSVADRFNILTFSTDIYLWEQNRLVEANSANIERAKTHVENLKSIRSTNINGALVEGLKLLNNATGGSRTSVCILFLLTDGTATIGETNSRVILQNTRKENQNDCSIITLGFGKRDSDVDFPFLTRIALANKGIARRIFDGVDVPTQLKGVYDEVATPLLRDLTISYLENSVDLATLTQTQFQNFFNGSELSVAGRLADPQLTEIPVRVTATGSTGSGINNIGEMTMEERINVVDNPSSRHVPRDFVERSWAFHTLEETLRNLEITEDEKKREYSLRSAFDLSQRYNLFTPVTSFKFINSKGQSKVPDGFGWELVGSKYNTAEKDKLGSESEFCVRAEEPVVGVDTQEGVDIEMLDIEAQIALRYARTKVTARIVHKNQGNVNLRFSFQIPRYAFVTNVIATSRGKTYETTIVDDENSKKHVLDGKGRIPRWTPTMETVVVSALAAPDTPITFEITYEELLERNDGLFQYRLNLYPRQIVNFLRMAVYVTEPQQIDSLMAKFENHVDNGQDIDLTSEVVRRGNTARRLLYDFTVEEQNNHIDSSGGIKGDMVITYDVEHDTSGGYMEAKDGYFVHYFSPNGLREVTKHVVFVIDTSASMGLGDKLRQTKEAVKSVIDDLRANDRFNVISFADQPKSWRQNGLAEAYTNNKVDAKNFINRLTDGGDTNLYSALIKADEVLDRGARDVSDSDDEIYSMIMLFTDGKPSVGVTDTDELVRHVTDNINSAHSLYAVSFGPDADFEFLVRLSAQNDGYATKIYVDDDAAKRLEDLYGKISSAVLMDTTFEYSKGKVNVDSLTAVTSQPYFLGSEIPSAGKLEDDATGVLRGIVTGRSDTGRRQTFQADTSVTSPSPAINSQYVPTDVVERVWAYLRVRYLLDRYARTNDPMIAAEIISVAQKYKFFTPLTPLVFVDPSTTRQVNDGSFSHPLVTFSSDDFALFNALVKDYQPPTVTEEPHEVVPPGIILEQSDGIDLRRFNIKCTIGARYSITEVFKLFDNLSSRNGRVVFRYDMPSDAVISSFKMDIDGSTYSSDAYDMSIFPTTLPGPLDINGNGGFVEIRGTSKILVVSVPVGASGRAQIQVTYERLLRRTKGKYAEVIKLYPGELVEDFNIDVRIAEPAGIRFTDASILFTNNRNVPKRRDLPGAVTQQRSTISSVRFSPSESEQSAYSDIGIKGEFVVQYDVIHGNDGGDIQLYNDYFVHHFSPNILQALRKNVVFVIDVSDSMNGLKLKQVKKAFTTILNDVRPSDRFNILAFSNTVFPFSADMVEASPSNVRDAQKFVEDLNPLDGTNLNRAVLDGINQLRKENEDLEQTGQDEDVLGLVILLTDGTPTQGEIVLDRIIQNVEDAGRGQPEYSIFCLGFGNDVDMDFLNRLALTSYGIARSIPASSDAVELLAGFYDEVATPLLYDIQVFYLDGIAADLSTRVFKNYFNGSEIVVVGRLNDYRQRDILKSRIKTISRDTDFEATADAKRPPDEFQYNARYPEDMMARAWAYYTLLELFESYLEEQGPGTFIRNEITTRAERYNFLLSNNFTFYYVKQDSDQEKVMRIVERGSLDMAPRADLYTSCQNTRNEKSWCDNDPHFVVHVPRSNISVCFDLNGNPDDVFNLVADPSKGIFVNALLIGEDQVHETAKHRKTYFGQIAFVKDPPNDPYSIYSDILINPSEIIINNEIRLHWRKSRNLKIRDISVKVYGEHANVTLAPGVNFVVRRHVPKDNLNKPVYLGIYMEDASGFSDGVHGIMGQFEHATAAVKRHPKGNEDTEQRGVLTIRGKEVNVKLSGRTDSLRKQKKECWKVEKNGLGVIRGHYTDYIQSDLFSTAL
ncbi:uncharacterized protein LOC117118951 [Anneissia japonica]|uniref:uncharacterized protein LOC117118951 n=1 Tax=Anneissia japonica TaxID=1529436 RepID=UPI00142599E4|nr:uncharacterized protein LOC117118951 [Anneissia japonica]